MNSSGQTPTRLITTTLANSILKILALDNIVKLTLLVTAGTVSLMGNFPFANTNAGGGGLPSSPVTVPDGTPFTITMGPEAPLDNFTIDASAGTCILIMQS